MLYRYWCVLMFVCAVSIVSVHGAALNYMDDYSSSDDFFACLRFPCGLRHEGGHEGDIDGYDERDLESVYEEELVETKMPTQLPLLLPEAYASGALAAFTPQMLLDSLKVTWVTRTAYARALGQIYVGDVKKRLIQDVTGTYYTEFSRATRLSVPAVCRLFKDFVRTFPDTFFDFIPEQISISGPFPTAPKRTLNEKLKINHFMGAFSLARGRYDRTRVLHAAIRAGYLEQAIRIVQSGVRHASDAEYLYAHREHFCVRKNRIIPLATWQATLGINYLDDAAVSHDIIMTAWKSWVRRVPDMTSAEITRFWRLLRSLLPLFHMGYVLSIWHDDIAIQHKKFLAYETQSVIAPAPATSVGVSCGIPLQADGDQGVCISQLC